MTATEQAGPIRGLYLLHLEPGYRHARHYLGWSGDIAHRLEQHQSGGNHASPLIRAALAAGSKVQLVRLWPKADRHLERRLKRQGGLSRHCPVYRAAGSYHRLLVLFTPMEEQ